MIPPKTRFFKRTVEGYVVLWRARHEEIVREARDLAVWRDFSRSHADSCQPYVAEARARLECLLALERFWNRVHE